MNLVAVPQFLEVIYISIFKYLFTIRTTEGGFLGLVLKYFKIIKINDLEMLYLYCLVCCVTINI